MSMSIDIKSAIFGGPVVALLAFSIGAVCHAPGQAVPRFEILVEPGDTFVLDSFTGQVWSLQTLPDNLIRAQPYDEQEFYDPKISCAGVAGDADVLIQ